MRFDRVSEWKISSDVVVVLSADFLAGKEAILFQIGNDALYGSFGDTDGGGDFSEDHIGLFGQEDQDVGMVGEEGPAPFFVEKIDGVGLGGRAWAGISQVLR